MQIFEWGKRPKSKKHRDAKRQYEEKVKYRTDIKNIKKNILKGTKLSELIYTETVFKCNRRGVFLISHKDRILIQLFPNRLEKNKELIQSLCKKERYQYFSIDMRTPGLWPVKEAINKHMFEFKSFIDQKAEELNIKLPRSELWFQNKLKDEEIFRYFDFEYNKPFKKFIYDVFSRKFNVVIEVDGSIHEEESQIVRDRHKDKLTGRYGYKMIRVKAFDENSYKNCLKELTKILNTPKEKSMELPKTIRRREKKEEFSEKVNSIDFKKKMPF